MLHLMMQKIRKAQSVVGNWIFLGPPLRLEQDKDVMQGPAGALELQQEGEDPGIMTWANKS